MITLNTLQYHFQEYLLHNQSNILQLIEDTNIDAKKRLSIYANHYPHYLMDVLKGEFPKVCYLMQNKFKSSCLSYIKKTPAKNFPSNTYGECFPQFLQDLFPEDPALCEMAKFEWLFSIILYEKEDPYLSLEVLYDIPKETLPDLKLQFKTAIRTLKIRFDSPTLWLALEQQNQEMLSHIPPTTALTTISTDPVEWILYRKDLECYFRPLKSTESLCLELFQKGEDFKTVCDALCTHLEEDKIPHFSLQYLTQWFNDGLIRGIFFR